MFFSIRKFMSKLFAAQPFSGNTAIQLHLEQRSQIEDYVTGRSKRLDRGMIGCNAGCMFGQWLHGNAGAQLKDTDLLDAVCSSCEKFHEAASQAVLLADMDEPELAKAALQIGHVYTNASVELQLHLERLQQRLLESPHESLGSRP